MAETLKRSERKQILRQPEWVAAASERNSEIPAVVTELITTVVEPRIDALENQHEQFIAQRDARDRGAAAQARKALRLGSATGAQQAEPTVTDPTPKLNSFTTAGEAWSRLQADKAATIDQQAAALTKVLELVPAEKPQGLQKVVRAMLEADARRATAEAATKRVGVLNVNEVKAIVLAPDAAPGSVATKLEPRVAKAVGFQRLAAEAQSQSTKTTREVYAKLGQPLPEPTDVVEAPSEVTPRPITAAEANEVINSIFGEELSEENRRAIATRGGLKETIDPMTFERAQGVQEDGLLAQIVYAREAYAQAVTQVEQLDESASASEVVKVSQAIVENAKLKNSLEAQLVTGATVVEATPLLTIDDFEKSVRFTGGDIDGAEILFRNDVGEDLVYRMVEEQLQIAGITDEQVVVAIVDVIKNAYEPKPFFGGYSAFTTTPRLEQPTSRLTATKQAVKDRYLTQGISALSDNAQTENLGRLVTALVDGTSQDQSVPEKIDSFVDALFGQQDPQAVEALKVSMRYMEYAQAWMDAAQEKRYALLDDQPENARRRTVDPRIAQYEAEVAKYRAQFDLAQDRCIAAYRDILSAAPQA